MTRKHLNIIETFKSLLPTKMSSKDISCFINEQKYEKHDDINDKKLKEIIVGIDHCILLLFNEERPAVNVIEYVEILSLFDFYINKLYSCELNEKAIEKMRDAIFCANECRKAIKKLSS
jgi:hypothetical protein